MRKNHIVLRASPDWLSFDIRQTRPFCESLGFDGEMIINFARFWDERMAIPFLSYRHLMKGVALESIRACRNAEFVRFTELDCATMEDDDVYYFTDDDDWVSPDLFENMDLGVSGGFQLWGSIYVGRMYTDTPQALTSDPVVYERPFCDTTVYTNNYALTGRTIKSLGVAAVLEHFDLQVEVDEGRATPTLNLAYLSAANKHPCCTMAILFNMQSADFQANLHRLMATYVEDLKLANVNPQIAWIEPYLRDITRVNAAAL